MRFKVISGGQTGVDRAALDFALAHGLECGGWCPKGRLAEDGRIADRYPLQETAREDYAQRTEANVQDSEATLILTWGPPEGGTLFTVQMARKHKRPCLVVDLDGAVDWPKVWEFLKPLTGQRLNIAGPRASKEPRAYSGAMEFLTQMLQLA